jgi:hypothetical protein
LKTIPGGINGFSFQKFYESSEEAFLDVEKTKIVGFLQIDSNFTRFFASSLLEKSKDVKMTGKLNHVIEAFLDFSFHHRVMVKKEIYDTFDRFVERVIDDCENLLTIDSSTIVFEALYWIGNFELTKFIGIGFIPLLEAKILSSWMLKVHEFFQVSLLLCVSSSLDEYDD